MYPAADIVSLNILSSLITDLKSWILIGVLLNITSSCCKLKSSISDGIGTLSNSSKLSRLSEVILFICSCVMPLSSRSPDAKPDCRSCITSPSFSDDQSNGTVYNDKIYGIWAWTDVRGIWYWKDMLSKAGVDPNSLKTWDGYIESAKKLNSVLRPQGIEGIHLTAAGHSPDIWYPYLWMLGGYIIEPKDGHHTKGVYWFPAYNSSEGVKAMEFIKSQVDAGIKPQKEHYWGEEFLNRKFAVMIEALQHHIPISTLEKRIEFEQKVGFIPMFPVPSLENNSKTATLMGGWALSIPSTSIHKDLAWELITTILEPKILAPYLAAHANLPTQIPIGEGNFSQTANNTIPYYSQLIGMIESGYNRPNIPGYPQIAEHIKQALDDVFYGLKEPKRALDDAAAKSAKVLGW
jgi:multiple sugar transport system substrate-binding protein